MKKTNDKLATFITTVFSTMWAFYAFILFGLTPLFWPQYQDNILYWGNFLQLIALPALAVGGVILNRGTERRDQETHDAVMEELADLRQIIELMQKKED